MPEVVCAVRVLPKVFASAYQVPSNAVEPGMGLSMNPLENLPDAWNQSRESVQAAVVATTGF